MTATATPPTGSAPTQSHTPGRRPLLVRVLDPLDIAGHASRAVTPSKETTAAAHAVYYLVLAALAAAEVIEPPVAVVLAAGHLLLQSHNPVVHEIGDALDEA